jgi:hypothetical protein
MTGDFETYDLRDTLLRKEEMLVASLAGLKRVIQHKGGRGSVGESEWRKVIDEFLPSRYQVAGNTEVIDHTGHASQQQDIVIYDRHFCPLFFDEGDITKVPAESVYAVFEVKPKLDKGVIEYAMDKAASVRRLERTNVEITDRGEPRPPRKPFEIVAGVLALDSDWSPPLGDKLEEALQYEDKDCRLQLGCALRQGAFEVLHDDTAKSSCLQRSGSEGALMFLLMHLFARLQVIGSPMAIDLRAYSKSLTVASEVIEGDSGEEKK